MCDGRALCRCAAAQCTRVRPRGRDRTTDPSSLDSHPARNCTLAFTRGTRRVVSISSGSSRSSSNSRAESRERLCLALTPSLPAPAPARQVRDSRQPHPTTSSIHPRLVSCPSPYRLFHVSLLPDARLRACIIRCPQEPRHDESVPSRLRLAVCA
jgi:hypothetical protein